MRREPLVRSTSSAAPDAVLVETTPWPPESFEAQSIYLLDPHRTTIPYSTKSPKAL